MLVIIPARGGSKRIPGKNWKNFAGSPAISYPISLATKSQKIGTVVVSTDNSLVADVAESFGVLSISRPQELADDFSTTTDVVKYHLANELSEVCDDEVVVCCYPTTFISEADFDKFLDFALLRPEQFSITVGEFRSSPFRAMTASPEMAMTLLDPGFASMRTQDIPQCFFDAGKLYAASKKTWLSSPGPISSSPRGYLLAPWDCMDLDSVQDWKIAEAFYSLKLGGFFETLEP